jgi:hypothetical protein
MSVYGKRAYFEEDLFFMGLTPEEIPRKKYRGAAGRIQLAGQGMTQTDRSGI